MAMCFPRQYGHVAIVAVILMLCLASCVTKATVVYEVDDLLLNRVAPEYISFTLDTTIFEPAVHEKLNLSSPLLLTLLKSMAPAVLRVGGSPADWLVFNRPARPINASEIQPTPVIMSRADWDHLVTVTSEAGLRLLFDLNLQWRFGTQWDAGNAVELFEYCVERGYGKNLDWELGNEPNVYTKPGQVQISPHQIGRDFVSLYNTLHSYKEFGNSRLVGPDVVGDSGKSADIIKGYLNVAGHVVDALTIHHYYFEGDKANYHDYIDPKHFKYLGGTLSHVRDLVKNSSYPNTPVWLGETSDAWHGGTANVSDRFVSAFLWLDKLGVAAQHGVKVVIRQTFWGHDYGLTGKNFFPNPDFWLSWIHKNLVGAEALNISTIPGKPTTTRVYAHCVNTRNYKSGGIVVFALNVNQSQADLLFFSDPQLQNQNMQVFFAEPGDSDGLLSSYVKINGIPLKMVDDATLPTLHPIPWSSNKALPLRPTTYTFIIFPDVQFDTCMGR